MDATIEEGVSMALRMTAPLDEPIAIGLEGAIFPLNRDEVIAVAKENEAPARLLTVLSAIPPTLYANLKEVQEAVVTS